MQTAKASSVVSQQHTNRTSRWQVLFPVGSDNSCIKQQLLSWQGYCLDGPNPSMPRFIFVQVSNPHLLLLLRLLPT